MNTQCPNCDLKSGNRRLCPNVRRHGTYYRRSDSKRIRRFRCLKCGATFSTATFHPAYRQKKRQFNHVVMFDFCSAVTQRRIALKHGLNRKTVARKLQYLSARARVKSATQLALARKAEVIEFDELEDKEHSKCKPVSIPIAVEHRTRRILAIGCARMPCRGLLAKKARKLYGLRKDERRCVRLKVLRRVRDLAVAAPLIKTDSNPHYPDLIKKVMPRATHVAYAGKRGSISGSGELKKTKFDPIFTLNLTCAMQRANISRLVRRTWATTKKIERLDDHLALFAWFHNEYLI